MEELGRETRGSKRKKTEEEKIDIDRNHDHPRINKKYDAPDLNLDLT